MSSPLFNGLTTVGEGTYEISSKQRTVKITDPVQIAVQVYASAKIRMLSFVYDFLDKYFPRSSYEIACTDTDSIYCSFAETPSGDFEDLVINREEYFKNRNKFFPTEACKDSPQCLENYLKCKVNKLPWVQPECCKKALQFDQRTPLLFKSEYVGDAICFLSPKSYCCEGAESKLSCKGVIKRLNPLKFSDFYEVLFDKKPKTVQNNSFRLTNGRICTYTQKKIGLTDICIKRKIRNDKVHSDPLDL